MDRRLFTANFKRDYVAYFAVVIFFLIVISEIALAISIPTYFVKSDLWAVNIHRQELFKNFDSLRHTLAADSNKTYEGRSENELLSWCANMMANYIRKERNNLSSEQAVELLYDVKELQRIANSIVQKRGYNQEKELDYKLAEDNLIKNLTQPNSQK